MVSVNAPRSVEDGATLTNVTVTFESAQSAWRSVTQKIQTKTATSTLWKVVNDGAVDVYDPILTVDPSGPGGTFMTLRIQCAATGIDLSISWDSIDTLEIDCALQTVKLGGFEASGLTLNPAHSARGWLVVQPGEQTWIVTCTVLSDFTLRHFDQWL